jgi:hypothetical protein
MKSNDTRMTCSVITEANCPQHIHKRFTQMQVAPVIEQLHATIAELEARLKTRESKEKDR